MKYRNIELDILSSAMLECVIPAGEYLSRYRDVSTFEKLCSECPNYGARWGCPPFLPDSQPELSGYSRVKLFLLKLDIAPYRAGSMEEIVIAIQCTVQKVRGSYETELLRMESDLCGRAALFTGMCPHCGDAKCARRSLQPCRHPELVRPSLEALGFDLGRTAKDFFDVELQWCVGPESPPYISLLGAVFY